MFIRWNRQNRSGEVLCQTGVLLLAAAVAIHALVAHAEPFIPGKPRVSSEMQTLTGVDRVRVVVSELPEVVARARVDAARIRHDLERSLMDAGVNVVSDDDAPLLRLSVMAAAKESVDCVGYVMFLSLEQPAHIVRLQKTVSIATWTVANVQVATREELRVSAFDSVNVVVNDFLRKKRIATRHEEQ